MKVSFYLFLICLSAATSASAQSPGMKKADSLFFAQNWAAAQKQYTAIVPDTSHNGIAWNRLGFSNYHIGNYTEALRDYNKALKGTGMSPPLKASIYSRMAKVNALLNKTGLAVSNIDSAIASGYLNLAEVDTLKDFNSIRNTDGFKKTRQRLYLAANPCMGNPHAREFDFWIGEWNVYPTGTKALVGHSLIQMVSGGCALLENWTSAASTGKSLNYLDANNKWKQTWVGSYTNGTQDFVDGEYRDGAMRFTFTTTNAQGKQIMGRFIFYNQGADQVRQFNETSADGGKTWVTAYDYTYVRIKT